MRRLAVILLAVTSLLAGCASISYYLQSIEGQMTLLQSRQSIADKLADPATPPALKVRLERALAIRDFASSELKLPDNQSYRSYADLQRPFVVWNVFAAAEFSLKPEQWCFPIAGCVGYRGYFSQAAADNFARELRAQGLDVYVGGVPAYSTLGWFDDPVLNTFVNYSDYEVARLIFHELAHQQVYAPGDSEFNESFAVTVETEGITRWMARHGDDKMRETAARSMQRRTQFSALIFKYRGALETLYRSGLPPATMRERKSTLYAELKAEYQQLKVEWGGFAGYDRFFEVLNNAKLASIAIYDGLVPQFQKILARHNGDLTKFYAEAKRLAALDKDKRAIQLGSKLPQIE